VLIADDHPLIRLGLANVVEEVLHYKVAAQAASASEAVHLYRSLNPDLLLIDLYLGASTAIEAIHSIRKSHPEMRAIVLSVSDCEEGIFNSVRAGAKGYLLKTSSTAELATCISEVLQGRGYFPGAVTKKLQSRIGCNELTRREQEILNRIANGLSNKYIAREAGITEGTVKFHLGSIFSKLGASNRTDAVHRAMHRGLIRAQF
jgi:two-component system NarL family response regulator